MLAIMIPIKPEHACNIMNLLKTIEVRKNTALANGIKKLIAEYGKARIYVYVSKTNDILLHCFEGGIKDIGYKVFKDNSKHQYWLNHNAYDDVCKLNGKVAFMFECEKVEEIRHCEWVFDYLLQDKIYKASCLDNKTLSTYLKGHDRFYAIHISNLTIFDKPKEIWEFKTNKKEFYCNNCKYYRYEFNDSGTRVNYCDNYKHNGTYLGNLDMPLSCKLYKHKLTNSPQNFCYIEVGE